MTDREKLTMELAEHIANLDKPGLDAFIAAQGPAVSWFLRNRQRILAALTPTTTTDAEQVKEAVERVAVTLHRQANINIGADPDEHTWEDATEQTREWSRASAIAAFRAMPLPTTTNKERVLRELERDARDSRFSDELIGNRFRAALSTGAKP